MELSHEDFENSYPFYEKLEDFDSGCSCVPSSPSNCSDFSMSSLDNFVDDWTIRRGDALKMGQSILDGGPVINPYINVKLENDLFENSKNSLLIADNFSDLLDGSVTSCIQLQDHFSHGMVDFNEKEIYQSIDVLSDNGLDDAAESITPNKLAKCQPGPTVRNQTRKRNNSERDHTYANNKQINSVSNKKEKLAANSKADNDEKYWEKRQKNNLAAKRSREMKRNKEIELLKKSASLEKENADLSKQMEKLKRVIHKLELKLEKS